MSMSMNQDNMSQADETTEKASRIDSSKLAESMPEDPGTANICLSCE